jgi:NAD+ diphosphatase
LKAQALNLDQPSQFATSEKYMLFQGGRVLITNRVDINLLSRRHAFRIGNFVALAGDCAQAPDKEYSSLRDLLDKADPDELKALTLGSPLTHWDRQTQFCGVCAKELRMHDREISKTCTACQINFHPQLQPVVIVLIHRGKELLLARGLPPRKHHSCLAGFVEPGESVETAIQREVKEEVGVDVGNIKYFSSQPWPFPSNLMLAFTAEWRSGDIKADPKEISDAQWFTPENPPEVLPPRVSVARQMIDWAWGPGV